MLSVEGLGSTVNRMVIENTMRAIHGEKQSSGRERWLSQWLSQERLVSASEHFATNSSSGTERSEARRYFYLIHRIYRLHLENFAPDVFWSLLN